jgi:hypothetical protein
LPVARVFRPASAKALTSGSTPSACYSSNPLLRILFVRLVLANVSWKSNAGYAATPGEGLRLKSVMFCHHGDWLHRTTEVTPAVREVLDSTSLANYFPLGEVPATSSGPLSALAGTSHDGAFKRSLWGTRAIVLEGVRWSCCIKFSTRPNRPLQPTSGAAGSGRFETTVSAARG